MIQLTTAFNPGDLDTTTYQRIRIISFRLDSVNKRIELICEYGNYIDNAWVSGVAPRKVFFILNIPEGLDGEGNPVAADPQYDEMIAKSPLNGETIYGAAARELYQWLLDNSHFAGTLVA